MGVYVHRSGINFKDMIKLNLTHAGACFKRGFFWKVDAGVKLSN